MANGVTKKENIIAPSLLLKQPRAFWKKRYCIINTFWSNLNSADQDRKAGDGSFRRACIVPPFTPAKSADNAR